jgi:quercetin dioxygenase-like cupin family protein
MTATVGSKLKKKSEHQIVPMEWGHLEWYVSAEIGNSETMTVGKCVINPGDANGRHLHPNCDEILTVLKGHIIHTWNGQEFEMNAGDVISIPSGVYHNARNIGDEAAELSISFSSAYRTTQDEV